MKKILISIISILCISNTYSQVKELDTLGYKVITGNNTISLKASSDNTYPEYKFVYTGIMYDYFMAEDQFNIKVILKLVKKYYSAEYYQYTDNQRMMFTVSVVFDNNLKLKQLTFTKSSRGKNLNSKELISAFVDKRFMKMFSELQDELKVNGKTYNKLNHSDVGCYHGFFIPIKNSTFK